MIFKEFGDKNNPPIIFIHDKYLSYWMWEKQILAFSKNYHVILPVLDGHDENFNVHFESINKSSNYIISYIDKFLNGYVFAICGFGIGSQIALSILAKRNDISKNCILESPKIFPKRLYLFTNTKLNINYYFTKKKLLCKTFEKHQYFNKNYFNLYYKNKKKMSKISFINTYISYKSFKFPKKVLNSKCNFLIIYGKAESYFIKRSCKVLKKKLSNVTLIGITFCKKGLCINKPDKQIEYIYNFFKDTNV